MGQIDIYTPQQVKDTLKELSGKGFAVEGTPTGLYADRASYGNRPTLAVILNGILPCQGFCGQYSDSYFDPRTRELISKVIGKSLAETLGIPERPDVDWKSFPEWNNESLAVASASMDDCIRNQRKVTLVGTLRDDFVFQFYGLKTPFYSFVLESPHS
jgi:hypothetical protein